MWRRQTACMLTDRGSYISADYDRRTFNIGKTLFPGTPKAQLVSIYPPVEDDTSKNLAPGPIAGIVVGIIVALAALAGMTWWLLRRRRSKNNVENQNVGTTLDPKHPDRAEVANAEVIEMDEQRGPPQELSGGRKPENMSYEESELDSDAALTRPGAGRLQLHELEADGVRSSSR